VVISKFLYLGSSAEHLIDMIVQRGYLTMIIVMYGDQLAIEAFI
jgi:hypothetical protein